MANITLAQGLTLNVTAPPWTSMFTAPGGYSEVSYTSTSWVLVGTAASAYPGYEISLSGTFTRPPTGGVPAGFVTGFSFADPNANPLVSGTGFKDAVSTFVLSPASLFSHLDTTMGTSIGVALTGANDAFSGGSAPFIFKPSAGNDSITGGAGDAMLSLTSLTSGVVLDLSSTAPQIVGPGTLALNNVHFVYGTSAGDTITGTSGDDTILGMGGNNILNGGAGNDTLYGNSGSRDPSGVATNIVHGGDGDDQLFTRSAATSDSLFGDAGNDILTVLPYLLTRGAMPGSGNLLNGGDGNDVFYGWEGGNQLVGGNGDDLFVFKTADGGVGHSVIEGGAGYDILTIDSAPARFGNGGVLSVYLSGGAPDGAGVIAATGVEQVDVKVEPSNTADGSGAMPIYVYGGAEDDIVHGGGTIGIVIAGGGGNDELTGTGGNDTIGSGGGNDLLFGGAGDDVLTPGAGRNFVNGGTGNDTLALACARSDYRLVTPYKLVGQDGSETTFHNIETIQFSDATIVRSSLVVAPPPFDALPYIASCPDLIAAFGADANAGANHYATYGMQEGRVISFDPLTYIASYPDLITVFGEDTADATVHFIQHGYTEGRVATGFDALKYIASYPDLIALFGDDGVAATRHYIDHGYAEGRTIAFDPIEYLASNQDLALAFGGDAVAAETHYIDYGFADGRATASFDALRYLASNPDLAHGFGTFTLGAELHWIEHGIAEGRSATAFDPLQYLAVNVDLDLAYGNDPVAVETHYIQHGLDEHRATSGFDAIGYELANQDLAAAGMTAAQALLHWVDHGIAEARAGDSVYGREQVSHAANVNATINDQLNAAGDHDWFQLTLAAGQQVRIALGSNAFAPTLAIANDHALIAQSASGAHEAAITFTADHSGIYYLSAASTDPASAGQYLLSIDTLG